MGSNTVEYQRGYDYLVGVNTPGGDARNVAATGVPTTIQNAVGDTVSFSMTQVSNMQDIEKSLGIDAQASGGCGLFSASARLDYATKCSVNSSSVFLIVSVQVTQAFTSVTAPGVNPIASALIASGKNAQFQAQYGDMFVRGLQIGGQFFGTIEITTTDESDKESVQVAVSGSYATFSASTSVDQSFNQTITNHHTRVQCYLEGGDPSIPIPITVDAMIKRATSFPNELQGRGIPYLALLDDYSVLPLPNPPTFADLQQQKDVLAECAQLRGLALVAINNIDYIVANPTQFIDATNTTKYLLTQWRNNLSNDLNTIATAASFAINNPICAKMPVTGTPLPLALPQRIATSLVTVPNLIGDFGQDVDDTLKALGLKVSGSVVFDPNVEGAVISQNPPAGTIVPAGSVVAVVIGRNE